MHEIHEIIEAKWLEGYTIQLTFSNLKKAVVDLKKYLGLGIFKELTSLEKFKQFRVDAELGTIIWPNGADIAPEVLYRESFSTKQGGPRVYDQAGSRRPIDLMKDPVKKYGRKK